MEKLELKKIFDSTNSDRLLYSEGDELEFKESFNWKSRALYAKSIAAFANKNGGYLLFGIKDNSKELIGLKTRNFEELDEATIAHYLNSVLSPEVKFKKEVMVVKNFVIGVLCIEEKNNKPVICIKNDDDLKEADIYYRYNAISQKIKYPELVNLLQEIREKMQNEWMKFVQKIIQSAPQSKLQQDGVHFYSPYFKSMIKIHKYRGPEDWDFLVENTGKVFKAKTNIEYFLKREDLHASPPGSTSGSHYPKNLDFFDVKFPDYEDPEYPNF